MNSRSTAIYCFQLKCWDLLGPSGPTGFMGIGSCTHLDDFACIVTYDEQLPSNPERVLSCSTRALPQAYRFASLRYSPIKSLFYETIIPRHPKKTSPYPPPSPNLTHSLPFSTWQIGGKGPTADSTQQRPIFIPLFLTKMTSSPTFSGAYAP